MTATEPIVPGEPETTMQAYADDSGVHVVRVLGTLDIDAAPRLREAVTAQLDAAATRICLELDGVSFIDSTGLAAIIDLQRLANLNGSYLALACGEGAVRRLIQLAFLERQLPVYADVPHALAALQA